MKKILQNLVRRLGGSLAIALFLALPAAAACGEAEQPAAVAKEALLARIFAEHGVKEGTFVLRDGKTGELTMFNAPRAATRFVPASTFKIPNSLIGLETGAVRSVDEILPYGGQPQPFKTWEHDMGLREAIRVSAVPIYQELARRIGLARMQTWVRKLRYGNAEIGTVVDRFWLDGPLKISAIEQTEFLARLASGAVPGASPEHLAAVREIIVLEKVAADGCVLHGKTGWGAARATGTGSDIGWWVGWVERAGSPVATFALNIDMPNGLDDAPRRVPLGKACLQALGVLPPPAPAGAAP